MVLHGFKVVQDLVHAEVDPLFGSPVLIKRYKPGLRLARGLVGTCTPAKPPPGSTAMAETVSLGAFLWGPPEKKRTFKRNAVLGEAFCVLWWNHNWARET